jgi:hypothetical protein
LRRFPACETISVHIKRRVFERQGEKVTRVALVLLFTFCVLAISPLGLLIALPAQHQNITITIDVPISSSVDPDPRNETSIAVSPLDERVIVGASKVILGGGTTPVGETRVAYYFSSDGGRSWGRGLLGLETPQKVWSRATDPAMAADLNGNFYLSVLMLDSASFDTGVYIFTSKDGGQTFGPPMPVFFDVGNPASPKRADKSYITIDASASSPFKNTVYAAWVSAEPDRTVILTNHLRPGDAAFSQPKAISHNGDMRGPSIATGPNGEFYAAWQGIGNPRVILFNASTDGGETFLPLAAAPSVDLNIHNFTGSLTPPDAALNISGVPRMNSFPVIDVDRSTGPNRGMIYVTWAETLNGSNADVFVKRLTPPAGFRPDVSPAVKVNNDTVGADQFFPWISVDATTGAVEVAFYDRRDDLAGQLVNMYVARSTDGGLTFAENTRVSAQGSNPRIQSDVTGGSGFPIGIGDYIGLMASRGKAHLLWADTRRGKQDIFYGQVPFDLSGGDTGPLNDLCILPREVNFIPYIDGLDTSRATSSLDDPVSCTGSPDTNTVWYRFTPAVDTVYGIDTFASNHDTVLSVYTGACGALTRVACNDNFSTLPSIGTRSILTFAARAGTTYLIEASGKGSGGTLALRLGAPTVTDVEYTTGPDGTAALKITGAGFVENNTKVTVLSSGSETVLPTIFYTGQRQSDATYTMIFATKKKLKKLIKKGRLVLVTVESPVDRNNVSIPFSFTR